MQKSPATPFFPEAIEDFRIGAILLIDKPLGWTSFDVVNKIKFALKRKSATPRIKVGHAGTLDPLATGLLVVCTGRMTKQISQWAEEDKTYEGTLRLGSITPSFDLETDPIEFQSTAQVEENDIRKAFSDYEGQRQQIPPVYSAKKIEGNRAFDLARKGKSPAMKPADVVIHSLEFIHKDGDDVDFRVRCSKGTYIRSLAHDIGQALGCGAHLVRLVRTESGTFSLGDAHSVESAVRRINELPVSRTLAD